MIEEEISFNVIEVGQVIRTLPIVLHERAENPIYVFNENYIDNSPIKESFRYFGILTLSQIKGMDHYMGYLTEHIEGRGSFMRGVIFTNNKDKIAIFHRSPNASIPEDYTLILRDENSLLYRGGVIPGKGHTYKIENHKVIPGQRYNPFKLNFDLSSNLDLQNLTVPKNIKLAEILAGFNPNFPN